MKCSEKDVIFKDIIIIFISALALRMAFSFFSGGLFHPEAWEYEKIAVNLYSGNGFSIDFIGKNYLAYATPLYPSLCALVYKLMGHNQAIVIFMQIIFSAILCVVIYFISLRIFGRKTALLAASISVIHPGLLVYSGMKLHAFSLDSLLIALTGLCFLLIYNKIALIRFILCGAVYGLCALTRATIIPFLPLGLLWLLLTKQDSRVKIWKYSIILILTSFIIIGSWSIRNFLVFKRFIPITTVSAENFWRGNNLNATGTCFTPTGEKVLEADQGFYNKIKKADELVRYDLFKSDAINFIKKYPGKFAVLFIKKLCFFWWFSPDSGKYYHNALFNIYAIIYGISLFLALLGITFSCLSKKIDIIAGSSLIIVLLLSVSISQALCYVEGRHRLAIEPILFIFTAYSLVRIKQRITGD